MQVMKTFPDDHFSSVITDSPYGISFMSKKWDQKIPSHEYWQEMLRVIKPGGHLLAAGLPRMFHRLAVVIEDSGWEIRDILMHLFGSGFPKSHNHFGFEGYGTALKPAWEGWILAMKPLDGTFAQNAEKWGVAGINIDACRIETNENTLRPQGPPSEFRKQMNCIPQGTMTGGNDKGRWPANLILDEESAEELDRMTGILKSPGSGKNRINNSGNSWKNSCKEIKPNSYLPPDSGGASRFFYCAKASSAERNKGLEGMPLDPCVGTGRSKPDIGRKDPKSYLRENTHPTVKPIALMEYLIKLIMPPKNGLILDPFTGSGTTIIAARKLGYSAIGIEKESEYAEIAEKRLEAHESEPEQLSFL